MLAFILYLIFLDRRKTQKFLLSIILSFYFGCEYNLFLNLRKCVDCYGDELCRFFQNGQIHLTWFGYVLTIINPNLTKSVYPGVFNNTQVVIKRKTQRFMNDQVDNVIICPSVQNVQFLYNNLRGKLWSNFSTSIEPLLLKYFESMEWPFPKYLGACGYLIVVENKGQPLSYFTVSDFKTRASLAVEILKMVDLFTFGHPEYIFYFTDYSFDNLVVDSNGRVFLVDLDNVIISSRSNGTHSLKNTIHRSEILHEESYAFSPSDICSHYLSDHNFFSVCKYLLSHPDNGLLRTIPGYVKDNVRLSNLLRECTEPEGLQGRFSAGKDLQMLLENIIDSL